MKKVKKEKFLVEGMSCASCAAHVEKAAKSVPGVLEASVSLLTNSMEVSYEEPASAEKIEKSIAKAGYNAKLSDNKSEKKPIKDDDLYGNKKETKELLFRLIPSSLFLLPLFYLGMGSMLSWPLGYLSENLLDLALIELLLSSLIIVINLRFFFSGFRSLFRLSPNMDSLVALGSGVSFVYSLAVLFLMNASAFEGNWEHLMHLSMNLSFESAGMVPTFVLLGKTLESFSKGKTSKAIASLLNLAPKEVSLYKDNKESRILAENVRKGDIIIVRPGEGFAVDGIVLDGISHVDESALTGEAMPVSKRRGSPLYSGTINKDGLLKMEATEVGEGTTLNKIVKLVEEASASKPKIAVIADKVAGFFVPFIILISLLVFLSWLLFGGNFVSSLTHYEGTFSYALERGISVLVISCPCALGLATPVAVMVASGKGAKEGLLFKNAEALEEISKCHYVVFDKTGTLTKGLMSVVDILPSDGYSQDDLLLMASAIEANSEHPLAKAIVAEAKEKNMLIPTSSSFVATFGKGVQATINDEICRGGNYDFINATSSIPERFRSYAIALSKEGKTPLYFAKGKGFCGVIAISDTLKEDAKETILSLKKEGYTPVMLTGDNVETAKRIALEVGIDNFKAGLLPADKVFVIEKLKKEGGVIMVGDGINDAPALTKANIGIAIGNGTDIAIESADIILTHNSLMDVLKAIHLSRLAIVNIKENLFWAFFYNLVMIPIAAGAYSSLGLFSLKPWMGAAAMSLSSVSVVLNALRINLYSLQRARPKRKKHNNIHTKEEIKMEKIVIEVEGMMCEMCAKHVKEALEKLGYHEINVDLANKQVSFFAASFDLETAKEAIMKAGYTLTKAL